MKNWFDEKTQQIDTEKLTAFGISLWTRYGSAREMVEMIQFAEGVAMEKLTDHVREVFYDSKADVCNFTFGPGAQVHSQVDEALLKIAKQTISQFEWHGTIYHGLPMSM
jgi:hypothetical protein